MLQFYFENNCSFFELSQNNYKIFIFEYGIDFNNIIAFDY